MFHKEHSSSTTAHKTKKAKDVPVRKSDRRALRQRAHEEISRWNGGPTWDRHAECVLNSAFLQGVLVSRQVLLPDVKVILYLRSKSDDSAANMDDNNINKPMENDWPFRDQTQCVWLQLDSKVLFPQEHPNQNITETTVVDIPSLALLAALGRQDGPILLPTIIVPHQVSRYLCRGAHLMRAGMRELIIPNNYTNHAHEKYSPIKSTQIGAVTSLHQRRVVAIVARGNPQPFAVGLLAKDLVNQYPPPPERSMGVGVTIVSCYGDDLWRQQYQQLQQQSSFRSASQPRASLSTADNLWELGHYGNPGFLQGKCVVPLHEKNKDSDIDDDDVQGDAEDAVKGENDSVTNEGESGDSPFTERKADPPDTVEIDAMTTMSEAQQDDDDVAAPIVDDTNDPEIPILQEESISDSNAIRTTTMNDSTHSLQSSTAPSTEVSLSPEEILHRAVYKALTSLKNNDLPMRMANFYAQHVIPSRPVGTTIDLKLTRYKKFGTYITEQVQVGWIQVAADRNNRQDTAAMLVGFDRKYPPLLEFTIQARAAATTKPKNNTCPDCRLVLTDLFCIPAHFVNLLRLDMDTVKARHATSEERRGTGMLTGKEMRSILEDYITRENLVDGSDAACIILDGPLTDILFVRPSLKKKSNQSSGPYPTRLSRKDIITAWTNEMESAYALVEVPGNRIVKLGRGKPPSVSIEVKARQQRHYLTYVLGVESFEIDPINFCKDVSHRFACSGSVDGQEIVFQGNWSEELEALLTSNEGLSSHGGTRNSPYRLPKNALNVILRKGVPTRKKGTGKK